MKTPIIKQPPPPAEEVPAEIIATDIASIAEAMKLLNQTRLSRKAIVTLLQADSKLPRKIIETVLNSLEELETTWLKPRK